MPVYEFVCRDCQRAFEVTVPMSALDPEKVTCPACGSARTERRWSGIVAKTSKKS